LVPSASPKAATRELGQDLLIRISTLLCPQILSLDPPGLLQGGPPIQLLAGAQILVMNLGSTPPGGHPILVSLSALLRIELLLHLPEMQVFEPRCVFKILSLGQSICSLAFHLLHGILGLLEALADLLLQCANLVSCGSCEGRNDLLPILGIHQDRES